VGGFRSSQHEREGTVEWWKWKRCRWYWSWGETSVSNGEANFTRESSNVNIL